MGCFFLTSGRWLSTIAGRKWLSPRNSETEGLTRGSSPKPRTALPAVLICAHKGIGIKVRRTTRFALWALVPMLLAIAGGGSWFYLDRSLSSPLHQLRECRAAAGMAKTIIQSVEKTTHARFPRSSRFNPILSGDFSSEAEHEALRHVPTRLKSAFFNVEPLDCSDEFKKSKVPIQDWLSLGAPPRPDEIAAFRSNTTFSRVVFSFDGVHAYTNLDIRCGTLCGAGHETRWTRKDGVWVLETMTPTWIL